MHLLFPVNYKIFTLFFVLKFLLTTLLSKIYAVGVIVNSTACFFFLLEKNQNSED
jgi:hypothetical protein